MHAYSPVKQNPTFVQDCWPCVELGTERLRNLPNDGVELLQMQPPQTLLNEVEETHHWFRAQTQQVGNRLYRLMIHGLGRNLNRFKRSRDYVNAVKDAVYAHGLAFEKAKILHRDISVGNILMTEDGAQGLFIDWELSEKVAITREGDVVDRPRRKHRMGTWQFISANILFDPNQNHQYADDLESFFWVLLYVALTGVESSLRGFKLGRVLAFFDEYTPSSDPGGVATGGEDKKSLLRQQYDDVVLPNNPALQSLLHQCAVFLKVRYELPISADEVARYNKLLASWPAGFPIPSLTQLLESERAEAEKCLKTSDRLISLFVAALEREVDWPLNDAFQLRDFSNPLMTGHEHRLNLARLRDERPSEHKRFMTLDTPPACEDLPWSNADLDFLLPGIPKAL